MNIDFTPSSLRPPLGRKRKETKAERSLNDIALSVPLA